MKKNRAWQSFFLTLMVISGLMALFYLPRICWGDVELRRVNILADIQRRDEGGHILAEIVADSIDGSLPRISGPVASILLENLVPEDNKAHLLLLVIQQ